jgi:hypothetical protein
MTFVTCPRSLVQHTQFVRMISRLEAWIAKAMSDPGNLGSPLEPPPSHHEGRVFL